MLILITGIILIGAMFMYSIIKEKLNWWEFILVSFSIVVLISLPLQGFNEKMLSYEVELIPLKQSSENKCYITQYASETDTLYYKYAYDNSKEYEIDGILYQEENVRCISSKVYESKDCSKPILKVFVREPKTGLFTLNLFSYKEYEYIFYVPEGTVIKNIGG